MAHKRYRIDIAIPETIPTELLAKPTPAQLTAIGNMTWIEIVKAIVNRLQAYAEIINAGTAKEEQTKTGKWHICRHADNLPCDPEQDI